MLSADEQRLIRLFRCMKEHERSVILIDAVMSLAKRLSMDPHYNSWKDEDVADEFNEPFVERLRLTRPAEWPEREWIELDDLGDPGIFFEEFFEDEDYAADAILGSDCNDDHTAEQLLSEFLAWLNKNGNISLLPIHSDEIEGMSHTEFLQNYRSEFVGFLR